jgi:hypothetical protein
MSAQERKTGDTRSRGNDGSQDGAVNFRLTIVGKTSVTIPFNQMQPGPQVNVSKKRVSAADRLALHVDGPSN